MLVSYTRDSKFEYFFCTKIFHKFCKFLRIHFGKTRMHQQHWTTTQHHWNWPEIPQFNHLHQDVNINPEEKYSSVWENKIHSLIPKTYFRLIFNYEIYQYSNTMDVTIARSPVYFNSLMPPSYALPTLILRMADLIVATAEHSWGLSPLIQSGNGVDYVTKVTREKEQLTLVTGVRGMRL